MAKAREFKEEEWEFWKKSGWKENQKKDAQKWFNVIIPRYYYEGARCGKETGWRDIPEIALKWYKYPWKDPEKALKAYNKGWKNPDDAHHYYYVIKSKGKDQQDEKDIMELYKKNLGNREIQEWYDKGFYNYKVISKLKKNGFDAKETYNWYNALDKEGKLDKAQNEIDEINKIIEEAKEWISRDITYFGAQKYIKYGIKPEVAGKWVKYFGIRTDGELDTVKKLIDLGLNAKDAKKWDVCAKTRGNVIKLFMTFVRWKNAGFEKFEDAKPWIENKWAPKDAANAKKEGKNPTDK